MKRIVLRVVGGLAILLLAGFGWLWFAPCGFGGCAPVSELGRFQAEGSQLFDIEDEPFGTLATVNRRVVPLDSLPPYLPQAFLAVEDQRFFDHGGVDWQRMGGAVQSTARSVLGMGGRLEGGSTISMQLARNLFPEHLPYTERSIRRKAMEIRVARQIEREFPKNKILELYLNHIYLGEGAYGVEAAAQEYFGKPAAELSLAEAAVLGGLPKAPSSSNPRADRERARERRDLVLREMRDAGYVAAGDADAALDQPIRLARSDRKTNETERSYFIERVRRELEEHVGDRFYTAGLKVYTTMDPVAQAAAEEELGRQLDAIQNGRFGAYRHAKYPDAKGAGAESGETPYLQGAVVLMDAGSGEIRALVGGRDFADSKFDRATQALRQPGSAFKPFVYATALERGRSPISEIEDAPLRVTLSRNQVWEPRNYTGRYDGMMTLREALTRSKNTPTVRLAQQIGMSPIIRTAHSLGLEGEIPDVPSAALGAAEVRPVELVAAYATFANGGTRVHPHVIRRIEDRYGQLLWQAAPEQERVLDPAVAFVLTSMLRDVVDRGTGAAAREAGFAGPAAGKTGTTNNATDVWFVGYTPDLVGGVWMGMDDPQTIVAGASGGTLAAPVWGRIMRRVYQKRRMPVAWNPPPGVVTAQVDRGTGHLVSEWCPAQGETYTEYFVRTPPPAVCDSRTRIGGYAGVDDRWMDEEWTVGGETGSVVGSEAGVIWPELEQIRQSNDEPSAASRPPLPPPTAPGADRPSTAGRTTVTPPRTPVEPLPSPALPDAPAPEPLGEPIPREPAAEPPPSPTPTPADTTGLR